MPTECAASFFFSRICLMKGLSVNCVSSTSNSFQVMELWSACLSLGIGFSMTIASIDFFSAPHVKCDTRCRKIGTRSSSSITAPAIQSSLAFIWSSSRMNCSATGNPRLSVAVLMTPELVSAMSIKKRAFMGPPFFACSHTSYYNRLTCLACASVNRRDFPHGRHSPSPWQ